MSCRFDSRARTRLAPLSSGGHATVVQQIRGHLWRANHAALSTCINWTATPARRATDVRTALSLCDGDSLPFRETLWRPGYIPPSAMSNCHAEFRFATFATRLTLYGAGGATVRAFRKCDDEVFGRGRLYAASGRRHKIDRSDDGATVCRYEALDLWNDGVEVAGGGETCTAQKL